MSAPRVALGEVRALVPRLFAHRPAIYWIDMIASAVIGHACFLAAAHSRTPVPAAIVAAVIGAFAWLRAVLFIHEISHFRRGVMPGFEAGWNLLVGVPLCLPSFMYAGSHTDHHKRHLYGTVRDPEYWPLAHASRFEIARFVLQAALAPILLVLRFGLLAPLGLLIPPLRRLVVERASSLVINPLYVRAPADGDERRKWLVVEAAAFVYVAGATAGVLLGFVPWRAVLVWFAMAAMVAVVNQVRTLAAHRYENDGSELDVTAQLLDSVNVVGGRLGTALVFPVGLRYHALHHLLPDMPYHSLGAAHRVLLSALPVETPYRQVNAASAFDVIRDLTRAAARGRGLPAGWARKGKVEGHELAPENR